jgi:hypothetical protein
LLDIYKTSAVCSIHTIPKPRNALATPAGVIREFEQDQPIEVQNGADLERQSAITYIHTSAYVGVAWRVGAIANSDK